MPTLKPPHDSANPPCNPAAAATEMMWACALATARASIASTARGLELWSHMLRMPAARPVQPALPAAATPGTPEDEMPLDAASAQQQDAAAAAQPAQGEAAGFASYRSPSGHAAAQVTVSE